LRDADRQLVAGGEGRRAEQHATDDRAASQVSPSHGRLLENPSEWPTVTRRGAAVNQIIGAPGDGGKSIGNAVDLG